MARLTGFLAVAAIVGLTVSSVSAQTLLHRRQQARLNFGSIQGVVSDERGGPLPGALVSALGATMSLATTDARGRFVIQPLAAGRLRAAHPSRRLRGRPPRRRPRRAAPRWTSPRSSCTGSTAAREPLDRAADSHRRRRRSRRATAPPPRRRQSYRDRLAASPHQAQRAEGRRRRRVDCRRRRRAADAAGEPVDLQSRVRQRRGHRQHGGVVLHRDAVLG